MENLSPLVTIIIPVFNGSNYLGEAIDSALMQTYSNIEIIVVNDGSTDNGETERVALKYGEKIRYYKKENGGVSSALNFGIEKMSGLYFSWLSHDDKYTPQKIENQIRTINENDLGLQTIVMCRTQFIDKNSKKLFTTKSKTIECDKIIPWQKAFFEVVKNGAVNGCSLLIPKVAFDKVGLFNTDYRFIQDYDMWKRIFASGFSLYRIDSYDNLNRIHNNQVTQTRRDLLYSEMECEFPKALDQVIGVSDSKWNFNFALAYRYAFLGLNKLANKCFLVTEEFSRLSVRQKTKLRFVMIYGHIRPYIRTLFNRLFRAIKTQ